MATSNGPHNSGYTFPEKTLVNNDQTKNTSLTFYSNISNVHHLNNTTEQNVHIIKCVLIMVISSSIIICNMINIYLVSRTRQLPRITRICLLNLSVSDLLVGLFSCLPSFPAAIMGHWPYGDVLCQFAGIVHGSSVTISIWSLSLISIDRYIAILKPLKYKVFLRPQRTYVIITVLWTLSVLTFASPLSTKENFIYYQYSVDELICGLYWEYKWFCIVTAIYIPVASGGILIFTNVRVLRKVFKATRTSHCGREGLMYSNARYNDIRAVKLLIIASVVYFVSWGPYVTEVVAISLFDLKSVPSNYKFITMWLANSNSFTNVFVYSAMYQSYRIQLKTLLNKVLCCGQCADVYGRNESESMSVERSFQMSQYG